MEKINPLSYVTDTDPVPEEVLDASDWYEWEYTNVNIPEDNSESDLSWLLSQGWSVYMSTGYTLNGVRQYSATLRRRKFRPDKALKALISDFTTAYNEGREINDQRYDEIVAIYNVMLDKSEDYLTTIESENNGYDDLLDALITNLESDYDDHAEDVGDDLDDYGDAQRTRIETQFDNELAAARQDLVNRGMYNSTVWASISAGIAQKESDALTELEDKIIRLQLDNKNHLYAAKVDMRKNVLAARDRKIQAAKEGKLSYLQQRNEILIAMLNFMERRNDDYPGLQNLGQLATQLGMNNVTGVMP